MKPCVDNRPILTSRILCIVSCNKYPLYRITNESVGRQLTFDDGATYLRQFLMPNFFFHLSMPYAICRMQGVPMGKLDFMMSGCGFNT